MQFKSGLLVLTGTLLFGCGSDSKDKAKAVVENDKDLVGSWQGDCTSFDKLGLASVQSQYDFNLDGSFEKSEQLFSSSDCKGASVEYKLQGQFETAGRDEGPNKITYKVDDTSINLKSEAVVKVANAVKLCGRHDWAVGEKQEVSGEDCQNVLSAKAGDTLLDVYDLKDSDLYFGETLFYSLNGDSQPDSLNMKVKYSKD